MAEQFKNQGGAANSDPNAIVRWISSKVLRKLADQDRLMAKRNKFELQRLKSGQPHIVEYFHQVDDGYSHLAAQVLSAFAQRYDVELVCHLVHGPSGDNAPESELLLQLSRYDSAHVGPPYGLSFPEHNQPVSDILRTQALAILAAQDNNNFIHCVAEVGEALWSDNANAMLACAQKYGTVTPDQVEAVLTAGTARRSELKHYSGAMFYYGEEWYWGVDRLYHLEKRLAELGVDRNVGAEMLVPRPSVETGPLKDSGNLTLEVYPSLRSPYTAIGFDCAVNLARETGVNLVVKPVLPMVMRGVPATREKGFYILSDTAREAKALGAPFGKIYDPIGDPVRRAYSLYPWACEQEKGVEFLSSFLNCAWVEGINTNNDKGLKQVVEKAGLDWQQAKPLVGQPGWEQELENNRLTMYNMGLWGVPSFRLLDKNGEQVLALWGQDRLWLIAREIQNQLQI